MKVHDAIMLFIKNSICTRLLESMPEQLYMIIKRDVLAASSNVCFLEDLPVHKLAGQFEPRNNCQAFRV